MSRDALIAAAASLVLNAVVWGAAAAVSQRRIAFQNRPPIEITRVIVDKQGQRVEKKVAPIARRPRPQPVRAAAEAPKPAAPTPTTTPRPTQPTSRPLPQGAHSRILTAPPTTDPVPARPNEPAAQAGGNARQGEVIAQQNPGNAVINPPGPVSQTPVAPGPPPKPEPPAPDPIPAPTPAPTPKPEPKPEPTPPPKPSGPTRDAESQNQVQPDIPDEIKRADFKSFVRVRVEVEASGDFSVVLRTSSGNAEVDKRVLEALKKWRWKPALRDGTAIRSTQLFKFEFEVN